MIYTIKYIFEDDFGCEEYPEDEPTMVTAVLEDESGETRRIRIEEESLERLGLDVGSRVRVNGDLSLEKA